ncbi:hypothetical protein NDU88_006998 [Pleurodeles waltl]|uniref:Uncharacterized protein n=1 Tax=Pleurodeles waltl TaxID=8319 RepID=A0AAV7RN61_PLEWA|nr:hypothetical protein NDU88_006998 [Pleurodeles waltl]
MGHLREDHKKFKERVEATENTVSDMHPSVAKAASHISALQKQITVGLGSEFTQFFNLLEDQVLKDSYFGSHHIKARGEGGYRFQPRHIILYSIISVLEKSAKPDASEKRISDLDGKDENLKDLRH